jgi:phenylpropionate dioxygenase-like ring-hydroxylating dioxygenase large terminal subunit
MATSSPNNRPGWAAALTHPATFAHEQAQLAQIWTFLGLTTDIPNDGDWFRAWLGDRSVFVQRFEDEIRGFENLCVHRFYPLRTTDMGSGVIRCGFHHWQYNKEGRAVGIPHCQELFGMTPRELDARLTPVEIAICGMLIFGRFKPPGATDTLEDYLDLGFPILKALCNRTTPPYHLRHEVAANWKLSLHISLDDYHIVAVHGKTLGKRGYLDRTQLRYFRYGMHSAFINGTTDNGELAKIAQACREGSFPQPHYYRIFQFFPNFSANVVRTLDRWYVVFNHYQPLAIDRTLMRIWYFPAPFPVPDRGFFRNLLSSCNALWMPYAVGYMNRKVAGEDGGTCEQMQKVAHRIEGTPILGLEEERIAWFEENYAKVMAAPSIPPRQPAAAIVRNADKVAVITDQVAPKTVG